MTKCSDCPDRYDCNRSHCTMIVGKMDRLSEIRTRCEAATPGPWKIGRQSPSGAQNVGSLTGILTAQTTSESNAAFIVNAREDIPYLLSEIERLKQANRIAAAAEADKDGRCPVLPCKVGDTVWTNFSIQGSYLRKTDRPYECKVLFVGLNESACGGYINFEYVKSGYQFPMDFDQIGKTVFLTREAALKAGGHR